MPPKPKAPAAPLKPLLLAATVVGLPIAIIAFVVGIIGMQVLLDEDGSSSLSQSAFGKQYKRLIAINPFFSAFFFNGGMIGTLLCVMKLLEHRQAMRDAKRAPPATAAPTAEPAQEEEAKKDK